MSIKLGKKREVFWDDYLLDAERTTAEHRIIEPVWKDAVFTLDGSLERIGVSYPQIVNFGDFYRMYYVVTDGREDSTHAAYFAVIESRDGMHWERPNLGILAVKGAEDMTNLLFAIEDNAFVFIDTNPACLPDERVKAIAREMGRREDGSERLCLRCYTSPDGVHFRKAHIMTDEGRFDTLNTVMWDGEKYVSFIRNIHDMNEDWSVLKRDVRVMYSKDFVHWTTPKLIAFDDGMDYQLYTNNVSLYDRAPHIMIGFPTRYIEKANWEGTIRQLPSYRTKREASEKTGVERVGRVVTDAIFMCSRDGEMWHRYNEAFFRNRYENEDNWVYADAYPSYGFVDSGREIYSMYKIECCNSVGKPKPILRCEIRKDGFACIAAGGEERTVVTKPLVFEGSQLHINLAGSAYGYMYVDVLDEAGEPISPESCEIYGNTLDRTVIFPDGSDFSAYAGRPVRLRFRMLDTRLFSMKFE